MIKAAYTKKRKEAERIGDEATAARVSYLILFSDFFFLNEGNINIKRQYI